MSVAKSSLKISAVTVIGIIHGTSRIPRSGLEIANLLLKKMASAKPIINWATRQHTVNTSVFVREVRKTASLKSSI